jgi:hypothetical protein
VGCSDGGGIKLVITCKERVWVFENNEKRSSNNPEEVATCNRIGKRNKHKKEYSTICRNYEESLKSILILLLKVVNTH